MARRCRCEAVIGLEIQLLCCDFMKTSARYSQLLVAQTRLWWLLVTAGTPILELLTGDQTCKAAEPVLAQFGSIQSVIEIVFKIR